MAEAFFADRGVYDANARAMTVRHAMKSLADWRLELLGAEEVALEATRRGADAPDAPVSAAAVTVTVTEP